MTIKSKLTIIFDDPFWAGVFECEGSKSYKVCKVIFGAEPTDAEIFEFILRKSYLLSYKEVDDDKKNTAVKKKNPKRIQREIKKEAKNKVIGTKAQNILKQQHEENKAKRKKIKKERKEEYEKRMFELKRQKRKQKHKGR